VVRDLVVRDPVARDLVVRDPVVRDLVVCEPVVRGRFTGRGRRLGHALAGHAGHCGVPARSGG